MKFFAFFALFCLISVSFGREIEKPTEIVTLLKSISSKDVSPNNLIDDLIQSIIELLRGILLDVIPLGDFPPLDINQPLLKIHLELEGLEIHGTNSFNVTRVKSNMILLDAEIDLDFPVPLILRGKYKIDGTFGIVFPIFGEGDFSIEIHGMSLMGGARIKLIPPSVHQVRYEILSFTKLNTKFEGLVGGELGEVIGEIIGDVGLAIFNYIEPLINPTICVALTDIINWIISSGLLPPTPANLVRENIFKESNLKNFLKIQ